MAFHNFVVGKQNKAGLSETSRLSRTTLWRRFLPLWNLAISAKEINELFPVSHRVNPWVLGLDGMWLHRFGAVMIYRDVTNQINLWWSWQASESYQNLTEDFYQVYLLSELNSISGVISDWKKGIVALSGAFFQGIPHQRCLAHLIREGKRLCPAGSPYIFTLKLREIVEETVFIKDPSDYFIWSKRLENWQTDYGSLLKTKSSNPNTEKAWWYTHGNLRRAIRLLTNDQENLFKFLHHDFLPNTNNSLEGVNSQIKGKLGTHRGMKPQQQISFAFWCLTFSRVKTKADLRKLWVEVQRRM